MLSPAVKRIFSPGAKRKREESTPMKRVRAKLEEGCEFETEAEQQLSCRALCDCVIACSAAKRSEEKQAALEDLEELLEGEARKGLSYVADDSELDKRLSGTPLYMAAMLDCPEAAKLLIDKGEASLVARFENLTPIEVAIKHASKNVLSVFFARIAELEARAEDEAPPAPSRPRLERAWTHSDATGLREGRLHRREENDNPGHAKLKSTRRSRPL